ncbi:hypothetical protein M1545_03650 [Patescibacteria group bacterium]|nr:hypothetical protein [Patescibacteria group bacterium]
MAEELQADEHIIPAPTPPSNPPKSKNSWAKNFFLTIFLLALISGLVYVAFKFGQIYPPQQAAKTETTYPSATPGTYEGIPINENTVSYATKNNVVYLRYREKIYTEQESIDTEPKESNIDESGLTWYGLVDAPEGLTDDAEFNRVFSFRETTNGNFVFVMRYGTATGQDFSTYYFDGQKVNELILATTEGYSIPKVASVSGDGMYASFDLYGCWNCGGHKPETVVVNLKSGENENIGKVSEFSWGQNGSYSYKEYIVKDCEPPSEGPMECFEEPETLPGKSGQI